MNSIETQMFEALRQMQYFLTEPVEALNETVRAICLDEVDDLLKRVTLQQILPKPDQRDELVMRHVLNRGAFPLAIAVMAERFLEIYENQPLPPHTKPIVDTIGTASDIPLVRARNLDWEKVQYAASPQNNELTWSMLILNADLELPDLSDTLFGLQMQPCYEQQTEKLEYSLFTRWNLSEVLPETTQAAGTINGVFLGLTNQGDIGNYLVHLQFMLRTWVELQEASEFTSLKEAILMYATQTPADAFGELMPPLAQLVVVDSPNRSIFHFGADINQVRRTLGAWDAPTAS